MIGPKKLSTIREELQLALTATGGDPIRWLEERIVIAEGSRYVREELRIVLAQGRGRVESGYGGEIFDYSGVGESVCPA